MSLYLAGKIVCAFTRFDLNIQYSSAFHISTIQLDFSSTSAWMDTTVAKVCFEGCKEQLFKWKYALTIALSRLESRNLSIGQMKKKIAIIQERRWGKSKIVWDREVWWVFPREPSELIKAPSILACTLIGQHYHGLLKMDTKIRHSVQVLNISNRSKIQPSSL